MLVRLLQPSNALLPILVTPTGIVMLVSPVQPRNAPLSIRVTPFPIVMLVSPVQSQNAQLTGKGIILVSSNPVFNQNRQKDSSQNQKLPTLPKTTIYSRKAPQNFRFKGLSCRTVVLSYKYGTPDKIRTCDPQNRNLILYPAELRARTYYIYSSFVKSLSELTLTTELRARIILHIYLIFR